MFSALKQDKGKGLGEPWQMATAMESRTSHSLGKGRDVKGKPGKGDGKKEKSKDAGTLVWNQQPNPVSCSMASSTPQTSTTFGTIHAIECTALDLCATALTQQENVNPRWIALNVDAEARGTAWPINADSQSQNSDK